MDRHAVFVEAYMNRQLLAHHSAAAELQKREVNLVFHPAGG